jgi:sporulation protein YlmC with PRC-barrel domain
MGRIEGATDLERCEEVRMHADDLDGTRHLIGETVFDAQGDRVGKVSEIAFRPDTFDPEWLVVKTSLFGRKRLVPFAAAEEQGDRVRVPFGRDMVLDAPVPEIPMTLARSERDALLKYYQAA